MLAVLEFYANAQNWETVYAGSAADGTQGPDFTPIDLDRDRRARQVLDLLETEEARVATLGGSAVPAGEMAGEKRREDIRTMSSRRFEVTIGCRFGPASASR